MDGVLVDSEPLHFAATRDVLARYGVGFSAADDAQFFGQTDAEMFSILCARHRGLPDPRTLANERAGVVIRRLPVECAPLPGVPVVLDGLRARGYRLAVASSSVPRVIATTLGSADVADRFEAVVGGDEVARSKPAPDIFLEAARRLSIAPARCAVIEDSPKGVSAAKAAGMLAIAIPGGATVHLSFDDADHRLESLLDLEALLVRVNGPDRAG